MYTNNIRHENRNNPQNKMHSLNPVNANTEQYASNTRNHIRVPKKNILTRTGANRTLIDTTGDKFQNSTELQHWASVKNLKTAAASYASADSLSELQKKIEEKESEAKSARTELVELEHEMKKVAELILYASNTATINHSMRSTINPRIRTDTCECTKPSLSFTMVQSICSKNSA